jgi:outer membrane protein insertion porin family
VVERFDGALDLVLAAEADAPMLEALRVDGRVERARLETGGVLFEQQGMATLALQDGVATLAGWRWTAPGTDLTLSGRSTLDPGALHYEVGAEGDLDLPRVLAFGDDRVGGTARVAMSASGGPQGLSWNGDLELRDGAWVTRRRGVALTDVDARVACAVGRCRVEQFTGQLNGGTIVIDGDLPVPGTATAARLHAAVRDAGVELPKGTRHDIDADLDLIGDDNPRLTGTLTVWPAAVSDSIVGLVNLVSSFQRGGGEQREPRPDAMPAALSRVAVDLRIVTGDNLTFDSHDLQVAATADLRVSGTLAAPQLRGEVATLERGRVFLAGRNWDLETGTVSLLEGPRGTDARVAATVSAAISKYVVQIRIAGPASQPTLVMTSDPPLGQSDVAELVLTGTTSGDLMRGGGQQVATLVSTELLTNVGRAIGIDAVRVEQSQSDLSTADLEPVSRLTISKRLTGKFEVIYSQGLSESDDLAWVLVYRPGWQALDLRATIRTSGSEAYEIRQELELGGPRRRATQTPERRRTQPDVSRVDIDGVPPDDAAVLRERLSLRAGGAFSAAQWQRDRESVASYFHDRDRLRVRVRASHVPAPDGSYILTYTIAPGAITRLEVNGYNVSRVTMAALREAWSHVVIEDLLAEEMTDLVRVELASRGYLTAEVTTRFRPLPDEGRLAIVDVAPGVRTRRRSIEFAGVAAIEAADLREAIAAQSVEPRCWLSPALLDEPVAALYHARGYLDARVTTVRTITEDRATLTVHVDEGQPFSVGEITVVGTTSLGEGAARAGLGFAAGEPFTDDALTAALARLRTAYSRAGYLDADIESNAVIRPERDVVDVAVTVKEGRQSVLREVRVAGRNATSAQYVARALDVEAGGPVDSVALDEAQQRLYSTGIFRTVDIAVRPVDGVAADAPTRAVEALVTLEERAEYRLRYGVQFGPSTIDSITTANNSAAPGASFDVQRRNVLGQGIDIGGGGVWSTDQYRIRGTASAAMFRRRFVSTTFTVEHANQDRTADNGLEVIDRSARAVLEQRWRYGVARRVEIAYGFDIDHRRVELLATTAAPLPLRGRFAGLNTTFTYDSRDNRFNARRGMFHTSRVDAGAGWWLSDVAFSRYQLQHFAYVPVGPLTFASGLRFGSVDVDDERQPASLLLYFKTGGGTSVRGYESDALTPGYVLGQPAGGKVLLVLNEEIRVPFAALESFRASPILRRLGVVAFVDAGNTFTGLDTLAFGGLKVGTGAGVRLDTPVAVVRFDLARPLWRPAGSPSMRWYLSIGQAF